MAMRNLIAMLGIVTLLVACGDKKDGGGGNSNPQNPNYAYDPNAPGGQWMGDLNNPTYIPPNQSPTGFHTPIPGCQQIQAPVFQEQGTYCEWLGNQQVWTNNCGFEVRSQIFERDCRAYREVHGQCFRGQRRRHVITDAEIERSVENDREYYESRREERRERWNDLMDDINDKRENPNYGRQPVRQPVVIPPPVVRQPPVAQPAPVEPPVFEEPRPTPPAATIPQKPRPAVPRPSVVEPENLDQCFSLEDIHNNLKNPKNKISSISDVILPATIQSRVSADVDPRNEEERQRNLPGGVSVPLNMDLAGYVTAANAPFGTFRYVGPDSKDRPKRTGWADGSAIARNVTQNKDGSIVVMNDTKVESALIMTGRILNCSGHRRMTIRFQESTDRVILPFTAELVWNGVMCDGGELTILMNGQYMVGNQLKNFEATKLVLWRKGSNKSALTSELELKKAILQEPASENTIR
jgi:hypothetical protein